VRTLGLSVAILLAQVWIVDRREQAFEDTSVFRTHDPQQAHDYYLGFHYNRVDGGDAKYVAGWG
jgi:hypothetical protein